jgi:hypothetical protein
MKEQGQDRRRARGRSSRRVYFFSPQLGTGLSRSGVEGSGASPVRQPGHRPSHSEGPLSLTGGNGRDEATIQIGLHGFLTRETKAGMRQLLRSDGAGSQGDVYTLVSRLAAALY